MKKIFALLLLCLFSLVLTGCFTAKVDLQDYSQINHPEKINEACQKIKKAAEGSTVKQKYRLKSSFKLDLIGMKFGKFQIKATETFSGRAEFSGNKMTKLSGKTNSYYEM